jgi:hypothetical protein
MKAILVCGLLFFTTGSIFFVSGQERQREEKGAAQTSDAAKSTSDQIEVKTDRFSGVTTVKLKPQVILDKPDHQMTIDIETKLGEKGQLDFEKDDVKAEVWFRSQSKDPVDFGDQELHFLIDDKPLDLGKTPGGANAYMDKSTLKPSFRSSKSFVSIFARSDLEQFAKAKRIEMRLGSIELTLGQPEVAILREYANQVLAQHKIVRERKQ